MNRKPIFDAVRVLLKRGFAQEEVSALDLACDLAEAALDPTLRTPLKSTAAAPSSVPAASADLLGTLSEEFESGDRGPGTVSSGKGDAGGVSYGIYQFASATGTCAVFVKSEGKPWADKFAGKKPGSPEFSQAWEAIAADDPEGFRKAQHACIERTHYRPVVVAVEERKGLNLDKRADAVRDATWSCAVQHAGAPNIMIDAIDNVDRDASRSDPDYDRKLIEAIYEARTAYVLKVANNPKRPQTVRDQLISITRNRYPKERAKALAMLKSAAVSMPTTIPAIATAAGATIDGNAVAAANGVAVKGRGVKIGALHPKMERAIVTVAQVAKKLGLPQPVITSGNDSKHMDGSLHYKGRALDFRGNNIKIAVGHSIRDAVAQKLGADYDVAFEVFMNAANNHLHVEYDPD